MTPSTRDSDPPTDRLLSYSIDPEETAVEALMTAFDALDADVRTRQTTLYDQIPIGAVDRLVAGATAFRLELPIWRHPVVLTPETVTIYAVPDD